MSKIDTVALYPALAITIQIADAFELTATTPQVKPLIKNCANTQNQPYPPSGGGGGVSSSRVSSIRVDESAEVFD